MTWDAARVDVIIPAGARDGTTVPVSLRWFGAGNLQVFVRLCVGQ